MKTHCRYLFFTIALFAMLPGCATIFNGTSQDVPIKAPRGTIVYDSDFDEHIPIRQKIYKNDTTQYIELKRNHTYDLHFAYNESDISSRLSPTFDGAWIELD